MSGRLRGFGAPIAALIGGAACVIALAKLPGRTASHTYVDRAEVIARPGADAFSIADLHWDLDAYEGAPTLAPFRSAFREHCAGKTGLDAAVCVSDAFARGFPNAPPAVEFFDASYDPAADLADHIGRGAPGHCVTRSGLETVALLSVGIPARQVQIYGPHGHNVLEVFDEARGWLIFDPTFGIAYGAATNPKEPISIAKAIGEPAVVPIQMGVDPSDVSDAQPWFHEALYPDPWLYTRVGTRAASWPFRGRFAHVGTPMLRYGLAQVICRAGVIVFAIAAIALFARAARRRRTRAPAKDLSESSGRGTVTAETSP